MLDPLFFNADSNSSLQKRNSHNESVLIITRHKAFYSTKWSFFNHYHAATAVRPWLHFTRGQADTTNGRYFLFFERRRLFAEAHYPDDTWYRRDSRSMQPIQLAKQVTRKESL